MNEKRNRRLTLLKNSEARSILDLDYMIEQYISYKQKNIDWDKVKNLRNTREIQKALNYKKGGLKRSLKHKIKKSNNEDEIYELELQLKSIFNYNLKYIDNDINKEMGKDFDLYIDDGFNSPYTLNSSSVRRSKGPINSILKKMKKKCKEYLDTGKNKKNKKNDIIEKKIIPTIDYNIDLTQYDSYEDIEDETDDDNGYPVLVELIGDVIHIIL